MSAIALIGLALLPPAFLFSSFLLPNRLKVFSSLFIMLGLMSALLFFNALAVEIPALTTPLAALNWGVIALFILFVLLELFNILSYVLLGMLKSGS